MPAIHTTSVWSPRDPSRDGLRILVTRFTVRGCPRTQYDVWMPNLAPSELLLRDFQAGRITWPQFSRRYRTELFEPAPLDRHNPRIKNHGQKFTLRLLKELARRGPLTLLCACPADAKHCHRFLLRSLLESAAV